MDLWPFKHQTCPDDGEDGVLLVDVETESIPVTDENGNPLYFCVEGEHTFTVDGDDVWGGDSKKR
jgi:hypothetical protein